MCARLVKTSFINVTVQSSKPARTRYEGYNNLFCVAIIKKTAEIHPGDRQIDGSTDGQRSQK